MQASLGPQSKDLFTYQKSFALDAFMIEGRERHRSCILNALAALAAAAFSTALNQEINSLASNAIDLHTQVTAASIQVAAMQKASAL
jgi:hypothetical protein